MKAYYEDIYYQDEKSLFLNAYSDAELQYFEYYNREKAYAFEQINAKRGNYLDLGCGEGYCLKTFKNLGYSVMGIDFSSYAIHQHNPELKEYFIQGDIYEIIARLAREGRNFDFITANNVLEHVADEKEFFKSVLSVCTDETLVSITVPNDFSMLQQFLFDTGRIDRDFWVSTKTGEHNFYFTLESLKGLGESMGFAALEDFQKKQGRFATITT